MTTTGHVDVLVVGCGAAGSAAAWQCARRGLGVMGVDRFEPGHRRGSSHGTERIVRLGHTDRAYIDFAVEAFDGWHEVEAHGRVDLLHRTGALDTGLAEELDELSTACVAAGIRHERIESAEVGRRFPGVAFAGGAIAYPDGGTVHADRSLSVLRRLAAAHGATFEHGVAMTSLEPLDGGGVAVGLGDRRVTAATVIVATGAWAPPTLAGVVPLPDYRVTQEQLAYFRPRTDVAFPTFIVRDPIRRYGMVTPEGLVKVGEHHTGPAVDPDRRTFDVEPTTWARLCDWVAETIPGVDPRPVDAATCLYASTPDEDFVLDRVGDVVVGVGLSGHGFKFAPAIGRRLADLADGTGWPGNPFGIDRVPRHVGASGHK